MDSSSCGIGDCVFGGFHLFGLFGLGLVVLLLLGVFSFLLFAILLLSLVGSFHALSLLDFFLNFLHHGRRWRQSNQVVCLEGTVILLECIDTHFLHGSLRKHIDSWSGRYQKSSIDAAQFHCRDWTHRFRSIIELKPHIFQILETTNVRSQSILCSSSFFFFFLLLASQEGFHGRFLVVESSVWTSHNLVLLVVFKQWSLGQMTELHTILRQCPLLFMTSIICRVIRHTRTAHITAIRRNHSAIPAHSLAVVVCVVYVWLRVFVWWVWLWLFQLRVNKLTTYNLHRHCVNMASCSSGLYVNNMYCINSRLALDRCCVPLNRARATQATNQCVLNTRRRRDPSR